MLTQTNLELIIKQANDKILENLSKGLNHTINDSRSLFYYYAKPYFITNDWKYKYAFKQFKRSTFPIFEDKFIQGVNSDKSFKVEIPVLNKVKTPSSISFDEIINIKF